MLSVYLDQSAYSQFLNSSPKDWRQAPIAKELIALKEEGICQVWPSPTNVLETAQAATRRQTLAQSMLFLSDAKRMWYGNEFERVREFLDFVSIYAPGFVREPKFFNERKIAARRTWIGALALLASQEEYDLSGLIDSLGHIKTTSRLIHARMAINPESAIETIVENVQAHAVTTENVFEPYENMTIPQMEAEISRLEGGFRKLGKKDLQLLNKQRESLSANYGAMEIGRLLQSIFTLPNELIFMLNVIPVVRNWDKFRQDFGCAPLRKEIQTATDTDLLINMEFMREVLQQTIYAAGKAGLASSAIGYDIVFREIQRCLNDKTIPTGGLTFDMDHAAAILRFPIIISHDEKLVESLKTWSKKLGQQTKGEHEPSIVSNAKQLVEAVAKQKDRAKFYKAGN